MISFFPRVLWLLIGTAVKGPYFTRTVFPAAAARRRCPEPHRRPGRAVVVPVHPETGPPVRGRGVPALLRRARRGTETESIRAARERGCHVRPILVIVLALGLVATTARFGHAFLDDPDAATLRGAPRVVRIEVSDLGPDAAKAGLTPEALAAAAREPLAAAGFGVDPDAAAAVTVTVGVSAVRGAGLYAYSIQYAYNQPVRLQRDSEQVFSAPTWLLVHTGSAFSAKFSETAVGSVRQLSERLVNNFNAVNPPGE